MGERIDLNTIHSKHNGLKGFFERLMRRFQLLMYMVVMLPLYLLASALLGSCLVPGVFLFRWMTATTATSSVWVQNFSIGISLALGFFLYGFSMLLVVPALNFVLRGKLKPWRGPYYSVESLKWFIHNGLTYLVRFTFLEFVTPTPFSIFFYRMMGMKIGRGVAINTTWLSDPSLIEIGNKVTLGGSVTIVAHYGQGGLLIIAPVKIGNNCTIGLKATIMGGATIGDDVKILPHSVVMPKTVIPAGETWGGVPAQKMEIQKQNDSQSHLQKVTG